jgi:hypothetical protein
MTRSPGTRVNALMISSDNPSLKYWFSGSALRLANGSTAIDGGSDAAKSARVFTAGIRADALVWRRMRLTAVAQSAAV